MATSIIPLFRILILPDPDPPLIRPDPDPPLIRPYPDLALTGGAVTGITGYSGTYCSFLKQFSDVVFVFIVKDLKFIFPGLN